VKGRVLVVEDNPASRELLCDWLESEGYLVSAAATLEEAYCCFRGSRPEVVLLDVQLGADDGLSLAQWIRRRPELGEIPVIAVTAHAMAVDQARILEAGCNGSVSKPVDFKSLAAQLDRWLAHGRKVSPTR
jgi:CheY-like chemotaxis protein